jgi:hypothetical protein
MSDHTAPSLEPAPTAMDERGRAHRRDEANRRLYAIRREDRALDHELAQLVRRLTSFDDRLARTTRAIEVEQRHERWGRDPWVVPTTSRTSTEAALAPASRRWPSRPLPRRARSR